MTDKRVSFFIVGVQKGGTTALHSFLAEQPMLAMSKKKELHFFDDENVDWDSPDYARLEAHFPDNPDLMCGEATPIYCYWPNAIERLQRYNPNAKLIMILRHPTYRAISAWKMERARANETESFEYSISEAGRARVTQGPAPYHRTYSYVERGFYAQQIERLKAFFPADQILFLLNEDLRKAKAETLAKVGVFLGVPFDQTVMTDAGNGADYIVPGKSHHIPDPAPSTLNALNECFIGDIMRTMRLTGMDLGHWLDPEYRE